MSFSTGEVVATKIKAESSDLVVVSDDYAPIDLDKRRAHICCGCDTRNAVLVVNGIGLCFYIIMVISFSLLSGDTLDYDDDQVQAVMDNLDYAKIGLTISIFVVGVICNLTAIFGAVNFNRIAIFVGGMWFFFETIRSLFVGDLVSSGIATCFCYPHAVFYYELKNGVMSRETYPKEKVCCDCCCSC